MFQNSKCCVTFIQIDGYPTVEICPKEAGSQKDKTLSYYATASDICVVPIYLDSTCTQKRTSIYSLTSVDLSVEPALLR
ncbi:MAG: hypothetical protein KME21_05315 [Desmonostoc vinosum HA7617-LM4]|jgi:hypothetical protein|nr:hypothetical protein [Desmonostoc vinosum HA7617-LM4]